jgi:hypothetical protein
MPIHFQHYKNGSSTLTSPLKEPVLQFLLLRLSLRLPSFLLKLARQCQHLTHLPVLEPTNTVVQTPARAIRMGATESPTQMGPWESVRRALIMKDVPAPRHAVQPIHRATRAAA